MSFGGNELISVVLMSLRCCQNTHGGGCCPEANATLLSASGEKSQLGGQLLQGPPKRAGAPGMGERERKGY